MGMQSAEIYDPLRTAIQHKPFSLSEAHYSKAGTLVVDPL